MHLRTVRCRFFGSSEGFRDGLGFVENGVALFLGKFAGGFLREQLTQAAE